MCHTPFPLFFLAPNTNWLSLKAVHLKCLDWRVMRSTPVIIQSGQPVNTGWASGKQLAADVKKQLACVKEKKQKISSPIKVKCFCFILKRLIAKHELTVIYKTQIFVLYFLRKRKYNQVARAQSSLISYYCILARSRRCSHLLPDLHPFVTLATWRQ